jgi:hypothetical protein
MSNTSSPSDPTTHDERGSFAADNPGSPGDSYCRRLAALRAALLAAITPQDVQDVMAALLVQAKNGSYSAARLYLAYSVGKPADGRAAVHDRHEQSLEEVASQPSEGTGALPSEMSTAVPEGGLVNRGLTPLGSPAAAPEAEPPVRLNARARAEIRRAERKRRKAEHKKSRQLELQAARQARGVATPTANGPIGPNTPSPIGANGPVPLINSV